jgi:hypothetical protein
VKVVLCQIANHLITATDQRERIDDGALADTCRSYQNGVRRQMDVSREDTSKTINSQTNDTHELTSSAREIHEFNGALLNCQHDCATAVGFR